MLWLQVARGLVDDVTCGARSAILTNIILIIFNVCLHWRRLTTTQLRLLFTVKSLDIKDVTMFRGLLRMLCVYIQVMLRNDVDIFTSLEQSGLDAVTVFSFMKVYCSYLMQHQVGDRQHPVQTLWPAGCLAVG